MMKNNIHEKAKIVAQEEVASAKRMVEYWEHPKRRALDAKYGRNVLGTAKERLAIAQYILGLFPSGEF